jgi:hypothetical protein
MRSSPSWMSLQNQNASAYNRYIVNADANSTQNTSLPADDTQVIRGNNMVLRDPFEVPQYDSA